jgi:multicomponent Na+:H+ antiporter subunit D
MAELTLTLLLIIPLAGILAVLAAHHFHRTRICIVLSTNLLTLVPASALLFTGPDPFQYEIGGWGIPYGIVLRVDGLSRLMLLLAGTILTSAVLYQAGRELNRIDPPGKVTYHMTFPMLTFSLNGLFLTGDFFNFYVFFELMAVSSYLLVAMGRHHSMEAAWKYAVQSILSSASLLSAVAFIYGLTGSLNMADVCQRLNGPATWIAPFILVAFMTKGSLFPFHLWQPDAYAAATTAGSAVLAGVLVNVGIYGLLRFWPLLFGGEMRWIFPWLGTASVLFGAAAAWREMDAKRMLGFSSTSQLGFVLIAMGWTTTAGVTAAILFLVQHGLSKAMLFFSTGILADSHHATTFEALSGAGVNNQWARPAYMLGFISLVGLPPAVGFVGKFGILYAGIELRAWPWVVGVTVGTILTLFYAGRAYRVLFWRVPKDEGQKQIEEMPLLVQAALAIMMAIVLAAGLFGSVLWGLSEKAAVALASVQAVAVQEAP